uniref:Protein kinase domain-containing protein n=1 Tax=Nothobranchius furzeri TaxID=105023 RepID=A0A8C6P8H8_NOTFU
MIDSDYRDIALDSIDDFLTIHPEIQDPFELEDLQSFIDLLKKMFTVNPSERITPEEALNHRFITMSHLPPTSNNSYVISAYEKMKVYIMEKEEPRVYIVQKFLGRGAFGQVVKGLKQGTDEVVALKFIHKDDSESATGEATILKHLRELQADQKNLIKLIDHFEYNDSFCFVFEMLDMDLFDLLEMRHDKPLDVSEVRVVAHDLLVALNALKNAGVTHTDIKPDNIMLVNHQSQPFRVKLIDFGLAMETHDLRNDDVIQVCGFRAPEVNLGLPLTEAVDMWAVACTLAFIFLGDYIYNPICEFNNMRQIFKLHGLPDQDLLGKGTKVNRFFIFDQSNQTWRFKTPQEYTETIMIDSDYRDIALDSIDDFLTIHPEIQDPFELEDLQSFIDLLKMMFTVNPSERITPEEALNHRFITMSHLPPTSDNSYFGWLPATCWWL